MKLTQIHTYRNGVFEGTNYRATHFRPMSRQPFFDRLPTWKYDNAYPPGIKEEKWRLLDVDKTSHNLSRKKKSNEKIFSLSRFSLYLSLHTAIFDVSIRQFRGIFKSYLRTRLPNYAPNFLFTWIKFSDVDTPRTSRALAKVKHKFAFQKVTLSPRARFSARPFDTQLRKNSVSFANKILFKSNQLKSDYTNNAQFYEWIRV